MCMQVAIGSTVSGERDKSHMCMCAYVHVDTYM